jgi:hypothetical protein
VALALGIAFFTMVALYIIELIAFTSNQLSTRPWINFFAPASAGILFMWWTMHRKERELVGLRDNFHQMLTARTSELHATTQVQIQNLDALKNALIKQRD